MFFLVTHTKDLGSNYPVIIQGVHIAADKIGGFIDVQTAIAVAQLAFEHRENKNPKFVNASCLLPHPLEG